MNLQIDDLDKAILKLLEQNARSSYAHIGREVGLSPSAIAERVQKMEDYGIIEGYTAKIDYSKLGYPLSAYITMGFNGENYQRFAKDRDLFPEIILCSRVTGNECLIMKVRLTSSKNLTELIDRLLAYGKPSTSVVLSEL